MRKYVLWEESFYGGVHIEYKEGYALFFFGFGLGIDIDEEEVKKHLVWFFVKIWGML